MDEASSAYDSAENVHATAARANDKTTAGPAMPTPWPMMTKMPVPIMAPTPMAISCVPLTARFSSCPVSWVSVISDETSRIAKMPGLRVPSAIPTASRYAPVVRDRDGEPAPHRPPLFTRREGGSPDRSRHRGVWDAHRSPRYTAHRRDLRLSPDMDHGTTRRDIPGVRSESRQGLDQPMQHLLPTGSC